MWIGRTIHLPLLILVRVVSNKSKDICDYFVGLVPDDTVKKGTSKRHEMDKKITHFVVHVSPSIFRFSFLIIHYT